MPSAKMRMPFECGPCRFCAARAGVRSLFLFRRRRHDRIAERRQVLEGSETLFHIPYGEFQHGFRRRRARDVDEIVPAHFLDLERASISRSSCPVSHSSLCLPSSTYVMTVSMLRGAIPVRTSPRTEFPAAATGRVAYGTGARPHSIREFLPLDMTEKTDTCRSDDGRTGWVNSGGMSTWAVTLIDVLRRRPDYAVAVAGGESR